jgi:N-acetylmuramoyl-L-alanine amidase
MFFITNRIEGRAMTQEQYQNAVVNSLFEGIQKYKQGVITAKTL